MAVKRQASTDAHQWEFKAHFRRNAFGWKSQPAITRVKQALAEIKKISKKSPTVAAEGAVLFIEKVSPALAHVDSSSGSLGAAVNHAVVELVLTIASAPADAKTRDGWLVRLFEAYQNDDIPYIERLGDEWGTLCGSKEVASSWADRLMEPLLRSWGVGGEFFKGTTNCLSALIAAERYDEVLALFALKSNQIWHYRLYGMKALVAQGKKAEAIRFAEEGSEPFVIAQACEALLLSSGRVDEAYRRYGLMANQAGTYLATFRAVAKKYPHKAASDILADLVKTTPGKEGKWFAAAKDAGLYDEAIALASQSPCEPRTLARAANDYAQEQPAFSVEAGLASLHWLVQGYGYEITSVDVRDCYQAALAAAQIHGGVAEVKARIQAMVAAEAPGGFVTKILGPELGLQEKQRQRKSRNGPP